MPRDEKKALDLYRSSADQGSDLARKALERLTGKPGAGSESRGRGGLFKGLLGGWRR